MVETFKEIKKIAISSLKQKGLSSKKEYLLRLNFEFNEIDKQGAGGYWVRAINNKETWDHNKNGLLLPFLLDLTVTDPIESSIKHNIEYHPDFPDIDIDFLPHARDPVKLYAKDKYGNDKVCSVGIWIRYSPKLALQDVAVALGKDRNSVIQITKDLPEEFDKMSYEQAIIEYPQFAQFAEENHDICVLAYKMVGKIKTQGKHAGGLVISNIPIKDFVPLTLCGEDGGKQWTSAWTEGMADTQLSKFGLVKFDILGLLNLSYIWNCCKLIQKLHGISIIWEDPDPRIDHAGWIIKGDAKISIKLNDDKALKMADRLALDSIFQFDTDFARSIVEKGGVKSFMDLAIYTSLGRPGPLPMIDVYIENRDDPDQKWKKKLHPKMLDILSETAGVLTYQEQLLRTWNEVCGFTMPEAEAAQKAVKKKKSDVLDELAPKVIKGANPYLGQEESQKLWDKMVSFGRYCFNKSHAVAYSNIAYRCLWLKAHFSAEWWAATLSECPDYKFDKYIDAARSEGIEFGAIDVKNLSKYYTANKKRLVPGLTSIKGIGDSLADKLLLEFNKKPFESLDDLVARCGKSRGGIERIIKLGGFDSYEKHRKLMWLWYLYQHDDSKESTTIRVTANHCYAWNQSDIDIERKRQADEYIALYPNRKKIPPKIMNWLPSTVSNNKIKQFDLEVKLNDNQIKIAKKLELSFLQFKELIVDDFSFQEILSFEKEWLGYYWSNPLNVYDFNKNNNIENAKIEDKFKIIDCVIENVIIKNGSRGDYKVLKIIDGVTSAKVNVWSSEIDINDDCLVEGLGVRMEVSYQEKWKSFALKKKSLIIPLLLKSESEELNNNPSLEKDSPPFEPNELKDFKERDFVRENRFQETK